MIWIIVFIYLVIGLLLTINQARLTTNDFISYNHSGTYEHYRLIEYYYRFFKGVIFFPYYLIKDINKLFGYRLLKGMWKSCTWIKKLKLFFIGRI